MKNTVLFILVLLIGVFVWACEDEDNTVSNDPTVPFMFFNRSRLPEVDSTLEDFEDILADISDTLDYFSNSIDSVEDLISTLEFEIDDGVVDLQPLLEDLKVLEDDRDSLNAIHETFEEADSIYSDSASYWADIREAINNGEVALSSITNIADSENRVSISYEDTLSVWNVPLDMNSNVSNLEFDINGEVFDLSIEYERYITTDEYGDVTINVFGFVKKNITSSTFDSLDLNCESIECFDGEVSISVYF